MENSVDVGQTIAEMQEGEVALGKTEVPADARPDDDGKVLPGPWEIY
jgi:hypothetical protein